MCKQMGGWMGGWSEGGGQIYRVNRKYKSNSVAGMGAARVQPGWLVSSILVGVVS